MYGIKQLNLMGCPAPMALGSPMALIEKGCRKALMSCTRPRAVPQMKKSYEKRAAPIAQMEQGCMKAWMSCTRARAVPQMKKSYEKRAAPMASCDMLMNEECEGDSSASVCTPVKDPLLQLISLQKASGCWVLELAFAEVLAKTMEDVSKPKPAQVDQEVWATVLALVWLYGFKMEAQEEWQFVVMKAVSWIKAQKEARLSECVLAGNQLLGCQVQMDTMGI
ncbi:hypothetical protein UPYG_G00203220 [Umbra pygmaea]|uniref:von Willebrand factor A domain-containing protein 5A-like n=1 Tax=Umbra pygmaea TaxID=75934 RepID=A0ABD0X2S7_UMBPY